LLLHHSTMVPIFVLALALPFAACGNIDMAQLSTMMQLMEQMNAAKGWGPVAPATQAPAMSMQNKEEYEAYLKWCAENQARMAEQKKQQELLDAWKAREEERKKMEEEQKAAQEAAERRENQMAQYKQWEKQMEMSASFDTITASVMEIKAKYHYTVVFEFLGFCNCADVSDNIGKYFIHEGVPENLRDIDLELGDSKVFDQAAADVAAALKDVAEADRVKVFFGGVKDVLCKAAKDYITSIDDMERTHKFWDALL